MRATQKYFRVMTPYEDEEAAILVLLPRQLWRPPVTPLDILLEPGEEYACGTHVSGGSPSPRRDPRAFPHVSRVTLRHRVLVHASLTVPTLDRHALEDVREVLESHPEFEPAMGAMAFRALWFAHPTFSGSGTALLSYLRVLNRKGAYLDWLAPLYPEAVADRILGMVDHADDVHSAELAWDDRVRLALGYLPDVSGPDAHLIAEGRRNQVDWMIGKLSPRGQLAVSLSFGMRGHREHTLEEIGKHLDVSRERARQIIAKALRCLRHPGIARRNGWPWEDW